MARRGGPGDSLSEKHCWWNGKAADSPYPREYGGLGDELVRQGPVKIAPRGSEQLGENRIEFCYRRLRAVAVCALVCKTKLQSTLFVITIGG